MRERWPRLGPLMLYDRSPPLVVEDIMVDKLLILLIIQVYPWIAVHLCNLSNSMVKTCVVIVHVLSQYYRHW